MMYWGRIFRFGVSTALPISPHRLADRRNQMVPGVSVRSTIAS